VLNRINYYWRLIATGSAFLLFGVGSAIMPLIAGPILFFTSSNLATRRCRARKLVHILFRAFIKFVRIFGILTYSVDGLEQLQRPGILVVANHPTLLDVVFLVACIPNADCIVKSRLLKNPVMHGIVKLTGYITNNDGEGFMRRSANSLREGCALIMFPEGTRTANGSSFKFQRGAANIAIRTRVNPTVVIINCRPATLSKQQKWYQIPSSKFHISIKVHDELKINHYFGISSPLATRQLTRYMEGFFTREVAINEQRYART